MTLQAAIVVIGLGSVIAYLVWTVRQIQKAHR